MTGGGPGADLSAAGPHLRRLDGVRGVAVALVVVYHAGYLTAGWGPRLLPGGFVGVDLFFVLSGFLITRLLVTELDGAGRLDLRRFGARRVRRLYPALVVAVAATIGVLALLGDVPDVRTGVQTAVGTLLYVSNWQQARGWAFLPELSHTWSLSIEAQFYLVWPFVLLAFRRLRVARAAQVGLILATMVLVTFHRASSWTDQAHYLPLYVGTATRIDVILAGCVLGLLASWGHLRPGLGPWLRLPALLGVAVLGLASALTETGDVHLYRDHGMVLVLLAASAVVASVLVDPDWAPNRVWDAAALRWLGLRSYSLYLWHVPVFLVIARHLGDLPVWSKVGLGVVGALALTEASYRVVERRFHRPTPASADPAPSPVAPG